MTASSDVASIAGALRQLDAEDLRHLASLFAADAQAMLAALRRAAAEGDAHAWARAAHRLAGGAAEIGARRLEAAARAVLAEAPGAGTGLAARIAELEALAAATDAALAEVIAAA